MIKQKCVSVKPYLLLYRIRSLEIAAKLQNENQTAKYFA